MTAKLSAVDVFTWFIEMVQLMDKVLLGHNIWVQFYPKLLRFISIQWIMSCLIKSISVLYFQWPFQHVFEHSLFVSSTWHLLVKEGMTNCAPYVPNVSEILNPLSAIFLSSWFIFLKKSEFSVICWSLDLPSHPSEINQIEPSGVIPIKYFAVW